jgi:hypothetical protein
MGKDLAWALEMFRGMAPMSERLLAVLWSIEKAIVWALGNVRE